MDPSSSSNIPNPNAPNDTSGDDASKGMVPVLGEAGNSYRLNEVSAFESEKAAKLAQLTADRDKRVQEDEARAFEKYVCIHMGRTDPMTKMPSSCWSPLCVLQRV